MKKYNKYKDSGIEWIGEIPEHWFSTTLKRIAEVKDGTHDTPSYVEEEGIPFITTKDLSNGNISFENCKYISYDDYLSINKRSNVENGDIIMPMIGSIGSPIIVKTDKPFSIKNLALIKKNAECDLRYIRYYLDSEATLYQFGLCTSGGVQNFISLGVLRNLGIPKMEKEEQTTIANYLDHKTTQIDTLIAKKEQFISLLQEERTAVINQAVTKGLDPKVKMKDSNIEWLGEIPEHWEVKRLRNLVDTIKTGSTPPSEETQYFEPKEINWYGPGDFDSLILGDSKRKISKLAIDEKKCRLFPANSILLIGIGATVGKVGLAVEDCSSNQQLNAIILKNDYNPIFYLYFLSTIKDIIVMEASSATLPIFNQTQTKNIITPVPPAKEQLEISNYIKNQEARIDTLISKSQQEIELLKEYKTALISEVVTGKVDVREEILN